MSDWQAVARVVNERMATLGLTQRELSEKSGVSVATLRKIKQGHDQRRSTTTLKAIARALGLAEDDLRRVARGASGGGDGGRDEGLAEQLRAVVGRVAELETRVTTLERDSTETQGEHASR